MMRSLLLAGGILAAMPVMAAQNPPAANLYSQPDARSIALQNWSSNDIVRARIQTTDGRVWHLAQGSIPKNQAAEIVVPGHDCIANVWVQFKDGRVLTLNELHDCKDTQIVVRNNALSIPAQAVPGARQHGTPG